MAYYTTAEILVGLKSHVMGRWEGCYSSLFVHSTRLKRSHQPTSAEAQEQGGQQVQYETWGGSP